MDLNCTGADRHKNDFSQPCVTHELAPTIHLFFLVGPWAYVAQLQEPAAEPEDFEVARRFGDMFATIARSHALLAPQLQKLTALPSFPRVMSLWGPNDDTYDTTDYFM